MIVWLFECVRACLLDCVVGCVVVRGIGLLGLIVLTELICL